VRAGAEARTIPPRTTTLLHRSLQQEAAAKGNCRQFWLGNERTPRDPPTKNFVDCWLLLAGACWLLAAASIVLVPSDSHDQLAFLSQKKPAYRIMWL
jgi:hypothetical protein